MHLVHLVGHRGMIHQLLPSQVGSLRQVSETEVGHLPVETHIKVPLALHQVSH